MPSISLRHLDTDHDLLLQVEIVVENDGHRATQDVHIYPKEITKFGEELMTYPRTPDYRAVFEYGKDVTYVCHLRLQVEMWQRTGASAIQVSFDNRRHPPESATGDFFLPCFPATVNTLGRRLVQWARDPSQDMKFDWRD